MGLDNKDYIFYYCLLGLLISDLMMQLVLIILTKRKVTIHYCELFGYGGTMLWNIIANDLTHVSVPVEDG
jgi:hypothetical protein